MYEVNLYYESKVKYANCIFSKSERLRSISKTDRQFQISGVSLNQWTSESVRDSVSFKIIKFKIAHGNLYECIEFQGI